jgi:hypothetical protein
MEHDPQEVVPGWYKPQPRSPQQVYASSVIKDIQRTLQVPETGEWDDRTVSHIRGLQHLFGLNPTGIVDEGTAVQIERLRSRYGSSYGS